MFFLIKKQKKTYTLGALFSSLVFRNNTKWEYFTKSVNLVFRLTHDKKFFIVVLRWNSHSYEMHDWVLDIKISLR